MDQGTRKSQKQQGGRKRRRDGSLPPLIRMDLFPCCLGGNAGDEQEGASDSPHFSVTPRELGFTSQRSILSSLAKPSGPSQGPCDVIEMFVLGVPPAPFLTLDSPAAGGPKKQRVLIVRHRNFFTSAPSTHPALHAALQHVAADLGSTDLYSRQCMLYLALLVDSSTSPRAAKIDIVGMCVARELQDAQRVGLRTPTDVSHICRLAADSHELSDECAFGCICGVQLLWVRNAFGRRGIASRLVDCARRSLVYGYTVPREHCAFSEPTLEGKLFAMKFTSRTDFLAFW